MAIDEHDDKRIYCPALGMMLEFKYCRLAGRDLSPDAEGARRKLPCARLVGCWEGRLDAAGFLKGNYSEEEVSEWLSPGPTRIERLYTAAADTVTDEEDT